VGANTGQTLAAVLDRRFRFDEIVCFEPSLICWEKLEQVEAKVKAESGAEPKPQPQPIIRIERFGLWNKTCQQAIFEPGRKGASLWKKEKATRDNTEMCEFVRATDWFKENIKDGDTVFLKLNCEGAECDILDDLLESGEFSKVAYAMIDFDVRKIATQKHREAELRHKLANLIFPRVAFAKAVMIGATHEARIKNWLHVIGADQ
jgi:FkbM family methyltransferase